MPMEDDLKANTASCNRLADSIDKLVASGALGGAKATGTTTAAAGAATSAGKMGEGPEFEKVKAAAGALKAKKGT